MIFHIFQMFPECFQITTRTTADEFSVQNVFPPLRVPRAVAWLTVHRAPNM